jgi:lantibiotic biosynthesis protein
MMLKEADTVKNFQQKLHDKCCEIDNIISKLSQKTVSPGLFTGLAGIALYKAILYKTFNRKATLVELEGLLHRIFDILESKDVEDCSYCSGLAGIGIAFNEIDKINIMDSDLGTVIEEITPHIYVAMNQALVSNNFDFLYGSTGLAMFLLKFNEKNKHDDYLHDYIQCIEAQSTLDIRGRRLDQADLTDPKFFGSNFGLSHGIPAILVFLQRAHNRVFMQEKCRQLTLEFLEFFKTCVNNDSVKSVFPNFVTTIDKYDRPDSRLAWCYGDIGIASTLLQLDQEFDMPEIRGIAIKALDKAIIRSETDELFSVHDPFFCHGSCGIAQVYKRSYQHTGLERYQKAYHFWLNNILSYIEHHDTKQEDEKENYKIELLNGYTGTNLVLLSEITDIPTDWDQLFLLS